MGLLGAGAAGSIYCWRTGSGLRAEQPSSGVGAEGVSPELRSNVTES